MADDDEVNRFLEIHINCYHFYLVWFCWGLIFLSISGESPVQGRVEGDFGRIRIDTLSSKNFRMRVLDSRCACRLSRRRR